MSNGPRYAIYFVPPQASALYRFGSAIVGYDSYQGRDLPHVDIGEIRADEWHALTQAPRRYGFHATLKAPFFLSPGRSERELERQFETFAHSRHAIPAFGGELAILDRFAAIVPTDACDALHHLASDCVTVFDPFRAPLSHADLQRRLSAKLNARQVAHLMRWGYPYVFDDFRFHLTLTGVIGTDRQGRVERILRNVMAQALKDCQIMIDRLALMRQDNPDLPFRIVKQIVFEFDGDD